jgi:hypothetical protein
MSRHLLLVVVVFALAAFYWVDTRSLGARQLVNDFSVAMQRGYVERIEVIYCHQLTGSTATYWTAQRLHFLAKPGVKDDSEADCQRKVLLNNITDEGAFRTNSLDSITKIGQILSNAYVIDMSKTDGSAAHGDIVAAAYFYLAESQNVYALYFSGGRYLTAISSLGFNNGQWVIDQLYYPSYVLWGDPTKYIYENYISNKLDIPVKH